MSRELPGPGTGSEGDLFYHMIGISVLFLDVGENELERRADVGDAATQVIKWLSWRKALARIGVDRRHELEGIASGYRGRLVVRASPEKRDPDGQ